MSATRIDASDHSSYSYSLTTQKPDAKSLTSERRILLWMCLLVGVNQLGFGAMVPSLPLYASSFGVSASAIGLAVAAYGFARFVAGLPGELLSDRPGSHPRDCYLCLNLGCW